MAIINPSNINEIEFDEQDIEVFKIPDVKERIDKIKKHFFPRLELLLKSSLTAVENICDIYPYEYMGSIARPNNKKAFANTKANYAVVGISGKRRNSNNLPLAIKNAKGNPMYIHTAILQFHVYQEGYIGLTFSPFSHSVEPNFVAKVRQEMQSNLDLLDKIFVDTDICYSSNVAKDLNDFKSLIDANNFNLPEGKDIQSLFFSTPNYLFPTNFEDALYELRLAFISFYPLLDLCISIGDGRKPRLTEMLNKLNDFLYKENDNTKELQKEANSIINLPVESIEEITIDIENIESKLNFNPENLTDARERTNRAIVQRQGQSKFRSELLKAYGRQCAISDCDAEAALEAAHIFPYLGTDTNHVKNGLLLRADIHTLFDLYLISINPKTSKIVISSSLVNTCYKELNGKSLKCPEDYASPSHEALARHYENFLRKQNNS